MEENFYPAWKDLVIRLNALKGDDDEFMAYTSAKDLGERRYAYAPASISGYAVELNCVLSPFSQPTVGSRTTCGLESLHFWEPVVSAHSLAYKNLRVLEDKEPSPTEEDIPLVAKDEALGNAEPSSHPAQDAESPSNLLRDAEASFSMAQTSESIELIGRLRLLQQSFIGADQEDHLYEYCKKVLGEKYFYVLLSGFVVDCSSPSGLCINQLDTWEPVVTADSDLMQFLSEEKEEEGQDYVFFKEDIVMFCSSDPIDESATSVQHDDASPECDDKKNVSTLLCAGPDSSITPQEEGDFVQGLDPAGLDCSNTEINSSKPQKERKNSGCFSWLFRIFRQRKNSKSSNANHT